MCAKKLISVNEQHRKCVQFIGREKSELNLIKLRKSALRRKEDRQK